MSLIRAPGSTKSLICARFCGLPYTHFAPLIDKWTNVHDSSGSKFLGYQMYDVTVVDTFEEAEKLKVQTNPPL